MKLKIDLPNDENIMLSGGAEGSDSIFGKFATMAKHSVIHYSFEGHKSDCPPHQIMILPQDVLDMADGALLRAAKALNKHYPAKKLHIKNLLRRNYYQVKQSHAVYGVGSFAENGSVAGGTGWAFAIYMDRFIYDGLEQVENCFLFEQHSRKWCSWSLAGGWVNIDHVPMPSGIYAGIGSREIEDHSIDAIKCLYRFN